MKTRELIELLSKVDPEADVFTECPETGGSWSIKTLHSVDNKVIIVIDNPDGPETPDYYDIFEIKP